MTTNNNNNNDNEFPPLPPSPTTAKSPTIDQEHHRENYAWTTVGGKTNKSPSPGKTGILSLKSTYKAALSVKGNR